VNTPERVSFERIGLVGEITIERAARRNALNAALCDQMRAHLEASHDMRAVVIRGAGSAFCAGADLATRFADGDPADTGGATDTFRPAFETVLDAIVEHPAPVIAAIHGPAIGAGMQLAVACDLRIAAPDAPLAIPGGKLGILLSPTNIWRLARLVGHGLARDFLLTGRQVLGTEALAIGLVQRVADDPVATARQLGESITTLAPLTVQGHKQALNLVEHSLQLGAAERALISELERVAFASDDLREGMAAFAEKRAPNFRGR
jgi:enoyl-CoA hydratase